MSTFYFQIKPTLDFGSEETFASSIDSPVSSLDRFIYSGLENRTRSLLTGALNSDCDRFFILDRPFSIEPDATHLDSTLVDRLTGQPLQSLAADPKFETKMSAAFGDRWNKEIATQLKRDWLSGELHLPAVEILPASVMKSANAAFSEVTEKIYLSREFIAQNLQNPQAIIKVLLEEYGHAIDFQINTADAAGDEGEIFAAMALGKSLSDSKLQALKIENDRGTLEIGDRIIPIEMDDSILSARNIGTLNGTQTFSDFVGTTDRNDFYSFNLTGATDFSLYIDGLTGDADVQLIQDINNNGIAATSEVLQASYVRGIEPISLNSTLAAGTYLIRTYSLSGVNTNYNLALTATPSLLPQITISASDASAGERNAAQTANPGQFTFTRTTDLNSELTVNYTLGGTATNGSDYNALGTSITFAAGQSSVTLPINIINDAIGEASETLSLTLAASSAYTLSTAKTATVTIADNDIVPTISLTASDATAAETLSTQTANPGKFAFTRTGDNTLPLTVNYTIGGTAINGSDYKPINSSITFAAGQSGVTLPIDIIDDGAFEATETLDLTLAASSNYTIGTTNAATVTIADNDVLPTISLTASDADAAEANATQTPNPGQFTFTRTGSTTSALTVNYTLGGTAINGSDYNAINSSITFAAGQSSVTLPIDIINDGVVEAVETLDLTLAASSNYAIETANAATVILADNDVLPTISLTASDADAAETNATQTPNPGQFTFTRTGDATSALTVNYTLGGTAINGSDYNAINSSITFAVGQSSVTLPIDIIDDDTVEAVETLDLTLDASSDYILDTTNAATITIADNDVLPSVTLRATDASAAEALSAQTPNPGQFTFTRTGSTNSALIVNYTIGGTAINGSDYNAINSTITFAAGQSSVTLPIDIIDDDTVEAVETLSLTLAANSTYTVGATNTATVTIADNDDAFSAQAVASTNPLINALWNPSLAYWNTSQSEGRITYSFFSNAAGSYYGSETVSEVSEAVKTNVRSILTALESYINVDFVEVADTETSYGAMRYMFSNAPSYAYAYYPYSNIDKRAGDVHLNPNFEGSATNRFSGTPGNYGYMALIHETLHALGLKHPGNYNGSGTGSGPFLSPEQDNTTNTVMSYNSPTNYAITPMAYDLSALQYIYGAKNNNSANTKYAFSNVHRYAVDGVFQGSSSQIKQSVWDSGGTDTFDFSALSSSTSYRFDLNPGGISTTQSSYNAASYTDRSTGGLYKTSRFGTTIPTTVSIENLVNSRGSDRIIANSLPNRFLGYTFGTFTGNDVYESTSASDILELSGYTLDHLIPKVSGANLTLSLGSNGSIVLENYYGANGSMPLLIAGNYYTYNSTSGWQVMSPSVMSEPAPDELEPGITIELDDPFNSPDPLKPVECYCSGCMGNGTSLNTIGSTHLIDLIQGDRLNVTGASQGV